MTKEEKSKIQKVLASPNPTKEISTVCREIVMDRIDRMHNADRELRFLIKDIIETSNFGCEVKVERQVMPGSVSKKNPDMGRALVCGAISIAALAGAFISEKAGLRGACAIGAAVTSFVAGYSMVGKEIVTPESTNMRLVAVTTVDEISAMLDKFTASLTALFDYRQIEGTHKDFLVWLQTQYSDSGNESFRKDIRRLLNRFNYRLEEFSESVMDGFEIFDANVEEEKTSVPALFSSDGKVILKGSYLKPLKK